MKSAAQVDELEAALAEIPVLDVHTHLVGGKLAARGLHDIVLYHMVISDLYAAGCPSGSRLTQYPDWPTREESGRRIEEALLFDLREEVIRIVGIERLAFLHRPELLDRGLPMNIETLERQGSEDVLRT